MTVLIYLLICFLYFVCVGLDIAMFFIQIRLILLWTNINWLVPFDNVGKPIVNAVISKVPGFLKTQRPLSEKGKLIIALLAIAIVRILLGAISRST